MAEGTRRPGVWRLPLAVLLVFLLGFGGAVAYFATLGPNVPKPAPITVEILREGDTAQTGGVETTPAPGETAAPAKPQIVEGPLPEAPLPGLSETTEQGVLPVIGADGTQVWRAYAKPFDTQDRRPRIALIVIGLGVSEQATRSALNTLPKPVTLAFQPAAADIGRWLAEARKAGHESLLMLPLEPLDYPNDDPGPGVLLTSQSDAENLAALRTSLAVGAGYVGIASYMGSKFSAASERMRPVLEELKARGLLYIDSFATRATTGPALAGQLQLPHGVSERQIDELLTPEAIDAALAALVEAAKKQGSVIAIANPYPVTFERIAVWAQGLEEQGVTLAPVSAAVIAPPGL
jgi:polysaccharide deacetylase 2 family uncharacterized protein YibQ